VNVFFTEIRQTLVPGHDPKHGPLPPLLVVMTVVTGLVDAFSYLVLGHVFVANMTGNVVFLAFALAGARGFSIPASLSALGAFGLGALAAGGLGSHLGRHRGRFLSTGAAAQTFLLVVSVVLAQLSARPVAAVDRYALIVVLAVSMGIQNGVARKLAVPDLTTTVLTLTLTGISADSAVVGGAGSRAGRRLVSVAAMLVGALIGALCVVRLRIVYPLVVALVIMAAVAVTVRVLGATDPPWVRADG
jgi:uncharacterized membrane protein YoaK (UPF0700 family)